MKTDVPSHLRKVYRALIKVYAEVLGLTALRTTISPDVPPKIHLAVFRTSKTPLKLGSHPFGQF